MTTKPTGMFFKEASSPQEGHFFRDMRGRDDAKFHQKTAMNGSPGSSSVSVGATGAPMSGQGFGGAGMGSTGGGVGGGMYGHGDGVKKEKETDAKRLKKLLKNKSEEKTASPSEWNPVGETPTGFHRPTKEQPDSLEFGGDRFHDSDAPSPEYGAGEGFMHGLTEGGSMSIRQGTGHQMGKHATPRFMGTAFGKSAASYSSAEDYVGKAADRGASSLRTGVKDVGKAADKAVQAATGSPAAMGIAALIAARMGIKGAKGLGKGVGRLAGRKPKVSGSVINRVVGSVKRLVS